MECSRCGKQVQNDDKKYWCECFTVYIEIAGKTLSERDIEMLFTEGKTGVIDGFKSKKGSEFSARLVRKGEKPSFDFGEKQKKRSKVFVQGLESGTVLLRVYCRDMSFEEEIQFGLVSPQLASCFGALTGCRIVLHVLGKEAAAENLLLEISDQRFAKYVLNVVRPKQAQVREAVSYLWDILGKFDSWDARYVVTKRPKLKGSPYSDRFPQGVFPWIYPEVTSSPQLIEGHPDD
ncbi:MAG: hypothetical protein GX088_04070 [Clostridia bacterium]|nr:hypothetical protein [Clostridia bacterium]